MEILRSPDDAIDGLAGYPTWLGPDGPVPDPASDEVHA